MVFNLYGWYYIVFLKLRAKIIFMLDICKCYFGLGAFHGVSGMLSMWLRCRASMNR